MAKYIIAWKNKTLRLPSFARILFNDVRLCFVAVVTEISVQDHGLSPLPKRRQCSENPYIDNQKNNRQGEDR